MNHVSIITESSLDKLNGNVARPKWEFESVKKNTITENCGEDGLAVLQIVEAARKSALQKCKKIYIDNKTIV